MAGLSSDKELSAVLAMAVGKGVPFRRLSLSVGFQGGE